MCYNRETRFFTWLLFPCCCWPVLNLNRAETNRRCFNHKAWYCGPGTLELDAITFYCSYQLLQIQKHTIGEYFILFIVDLIRLATCNKIKKGVFWKELFFFPPNTHGITLRLIARGPSRGSLIALQAGLHFTVHALWGKVWGYVSDCTLNYL